MSKCLVNIHGDIEGDYEIIDDSGDYVPLSVIEDIKAEILEETECHYGDKCLGANCPSNTDCMIMGGHAIWIIDKHISGKDEHGKV